MRLARKARWMWFGLILWGAVAGPALAQDEEAREHFRRGEAAYSQGNYELALGEWKKAYAIDPRPRIQYNMYQAYERLGDLNAAQNALQSYLSSADPDDPHYSEATSRMAALRQRLGATGIRIVGGGDGASIEVSGTTWGRTPRPDKIPVQPGNHRVVIKLAGYKDFVSSVVVPAGQTVEVPVELTPLTGADEEPADEAGTGEVTPSGRDAAADATPWYVTSAVLGVGAVGGLLWTLNRSAELDGCDDSRNFCPEEDTVSTQGNIALATTIVLGAGAVGTLIYGLILDSNDGERALVCVPGVLSAQCRVRF